MLESDLASVPARISKSTYCLRVNASLPPSSRRRVGKTLRHSTIVLLLLISAALIHPRAYAVLPHRGPKEMHKEIETIEAQWRAANLANDVSTIDSLLADDYLAVTANGTLQDKAQTLAQRRAGTVHFDRLDISDQKIRIYGDTAVVTSKAEVAGMNGGQDVTGHYRYTRVYNRRLGKWKIVGFQASEIHDHSQRH